MSLPSPTETCQLPPSPPVVPPVTHLRAVSMIANVTGRVEIAGLMDWFWEYIGPVRDTTPQKVVAKSEDEQLFSVFHVGENQLRVGIWTPLAEEQAWPYLIHFFPAFSWRLSVNIEIELSEVILFNPLTGTYDRKHRGIRDIIVPVSPEHLTTWRVGLRLKPKEKPRSN